MKQRKTLAKKSRYRGAEEDKGIHCKTRGTEWSQRESKVNKVTEIETDKQNQIDNFINRNKENFDPGNLSLVHKLKK